MYESQVTKEMVDDWFSALSEDAAETGETMACESVRDEARRIAHVLHKHLPTDTDVYLMDGGKVAIEFYGDFGHGFLLVCEPGGSALCIVTAASISRRARHESSSDLPDGFIYDGLRDVQPGSVRS